MMVEAFFEIMKLLDKPMNAKEPKDYLKARAKQLDLTKPFWGDQKVSAAQAIGAMEDYHQAKSKEEAEERYEIAKYCLGCDSSGIRLRTTPLIEHAIKLAAFGKEDNQ